MTLGPVTQVADVVWFARGTDTNWVLLRDQGGDVTLIDSGWPGDTAAVEASIRDIGAQPADVRALLITHAHDALDLPGHPVPVATHGHTSGHTAYWLPQVGAVATGDGLVTGHPLVRRPGPQVLPAFFNHGDALAALAPLADLDAEFVLPGHGEALRRPIRDCVDQARERG